MRRTILARLTQNVLPETLCLVTLCLADLVWTIWAVETGIAKESNPLLAGLMHSPLLFAVVKLVSFLLPVSVLELMRARWPATASLGLRMGAISYVLVYVVGSLQVHGLLDLPHVH